MNQNEAEWLIITPPRCSPKSGLASRYLTSTPRTNSHLLFYSKILYRKNVAWLIIKVFFFWNFWWTISLKYVTSVLLIRRFWVCRRSSLLGWYWYIAPIYNYHYISCITCCLFVYAINKYSDYKKKITLFVSSKIQRTISPGVCVCSYMVKTQRYFPFVWKKKRHNLVTEIRVNSVFFFFLFPSL